MAMVTLKHETASMPDSLSVNDVTHDLIPKLQATERLVDSTLRARIERSVEAGEQARLEELKAEFELEIAMIRMNLEHLMRRYSQQLEAALDDHRQEDSARLTLDAHEAVAVESARTLYRRAQALAT